MPRRITGEIEIEDIDYVRAIVWTRNRHLQLNPNHTKVPLSDRNAIELIIKNYANVITAMQA